MSAEESSLAEGLHLEGDWEHVSFSVEVLYVVEPVGIRLGLVCLALEHEEVPHDDQCRRRHHRQERVEACEHLVSYGQEVVDDEELSEAREQDIEGFLQVVVLVSQRVHELFEGSPGHH